MKQKLIMLGKHGGKILVGGPADGSAEQDDEAEKLEQMLEQKSGYKKRAPTDIEPFMLHAPPCSMYDELLHAFEAKGLIGLAGDGRGALACLENRLPFFGLTLSEAHTSTLMTYLEAKVFEKMANPKSKLHVPGLAKLLDIEPEVTGNNETEQETKSRRGRGGRGGGRGRKGLGRKLPKTVKKTKTKSEPASKPKADEGGDEPDETPESCAGLLEHVKNLAAAAGKS